MFTIIDNKVYIVENDKMLPVNVSREKGIEKVGQAKDLPKTYNVYTINEILVKFNIKDNEPYYFDKEKYERELAEAKVKKEAELKEELKAKMEAESKKRSDKTYWNKTRRE